MVVGSAGVGRAEEPGGRELEHLRQASVIGSPRFEARHLKPRGINIFDDARIWQRGVTRQDEDVWQHFGTSPPAGISPEDAAAAYRSLPGLHWTHDIWVATDDKRLSGIAAHWNGMHYYRYSREDYFTHASTTFFHGEWSSMLDAAIPKTADTPPDAAIGRRLVDGDGRRKPARAGGMLPVRILGDEMEPCPAKNWEAPPILHRSSQAPPNSTREQDFNFEMVIDSAYWLHFPLFIAPEHEDLAKDHVFFGRKKSVCPYLTTALSEEDYRDVVEHRNAKNSIAAAAALALYNRLRLRTKALNKAAGEQQHVWKKEDVEDLRHYGLYILGRCYGYWIVRPLVSMEDGSWQGCEMKLLVRGLMVDKVQVKVLVQWLNEIHRWGLTVHGPAVRHDINVCMGVEQP